MKNVFYFEGVVGLGPSECIPCILGRLIVQIEIAANIIELISILQLVAVHGDGTVKVV